MRRSSARPDEPPSLNRVIVFLLAVFTVIGGVVLALGDPNALVAVGLCWFVYGAFIVAFKSGIP